MDSGTSVGCGCIYKWREEHIYRHNDQMLAEEGETTSIFCTLTQKSRFDEALQVLRSVVISSDLPSFLHISIILQQFLKSEFQKIIIEIKDKTVDRKLGILDFFVCAFALVEDAESSIALRYEALTLREHHSRFNMELQVSDQEWLTFAEHSFNKGFCFIARKACEIALSTLANDISVSQIGCSSSNKHLIEKLKNLRDAATSTINRTSVQAQADRYIRSRSFKKNHNHPSPRLKESHTASFMFVSGIRKRTARRFDEVSQNYCLKRAMGDTSLKKGSFK